MYLITAIIGFSFEILKRVELTQKITPEFSIYKHNFVTSQTSLLNLRNNVFQIKLAIQIAQRRNDVIQV